MLIFAASNSSMLTSFETVMAWMRISNRSMASLFRTLFPVITLARLSFSVSVSGFPAVSWKCCLYSYFFSAHVRPQFLIVKCESEPSTLRKSWILNSGQSIVSWTVFAWRPIWSFTLSERRSEEYYKPLLKITPKNYKSFHLQSIPWWLQKIWLTFCFTSLRKTHPGTNFFKPF